jgi:hypothetical protein
MSVQLILKNSSVQDKAATAQQLEIGEIALNYHESGPFLQCKDTAGQVWRIGGVIVADEAPGQPQPGTWWFETDTKGLYFYDGTGWTEITGGGGGAGDITAVVAGEGLSGGGNSGSVTLDADLDLTKGLEFTVSGVPGSKIAIKPGANISFDTDGSLRADVGGASIKGSVDLTGATIPSPVSANDGYYNTGSGTLSTEWQAATGLGAISVEPSDLVVFNGTNWTYVPAAPSAVASVFGRVGAVVGAEGDYDIGQLGDVDTTSAAPTTGDVLQYDGTNWVPVDETVVAPVQSVHGRTGAVVSAEGDYDLDELGDVDLTSTPPVNNDVLQYNGSAWVPVTGTSLGYWDRTGTVLSAANTGDQIQLTGALDVNDQPINTTVTDGDIDLDANGAGLIQVTEFNLSQVPIVTQHDIGTDANEVPLNGMLGGMAFQDPASVSLDSINGDVYFDSSGRLLVGTSTAPTVGVSNDALFVVQGYEGVPAGDSLISLQRGQAPASIFSGAYLGSITFGANDGSPYAQIHAATDGTGGTNDYPGRLVFSTTADSGSAPTERMRIDSSGRVGIGTTSPTAQLEIGGNVSLGTRRAAYLRYPNDSANPGRTAFEITGNESGTEKAVFKIDGAGSIVGNTFNGTVFRNSGGIERARITLDGYVRLASGTGGIQFNGDTAAANALDDYEEGTWVPNAGPGVTVSGTFSSVGRYTKIGRVVCYEGYISATTSVAFNPVGGVFVTGLPFSVVAGSGATGDAVNSSVSAFMHVIAGGTSLYGSTSIPATTTITFAGQYIV